MHDIERLTLALVVAAAAAMSRKISWNICGAMATSAIWKIT
jgi:hypothetical protein